jgi:hypothetical protein
LAGKLYLLIGDGNEELFGAMAGISRLNFIAKYFNYSFDLKHYKVKLIMAFE